MSVCTECERWASMEGLTEFSIGGWLLMPDKKLTNCPGWLLICEFAVHSVLQGYHDNNQNYEA